VLLLKADETVEADNLFQEALEYNPHFGWAHFYRGQLLEKKSKDAEAMSEYKEAVAGDPNLRQAWLALGRQYTRQGNKAEADKALENFKRLESEENARRQRKN
jgi:tetratricopeptide (TPR) repeat protein